ncbi:MAG: NAD-dependent epimerase/dehydratase family protein [Planctomycetota bacterium]
MRVFVTGGTGLLGNTILRQLDGADVKLTALVRQPPDPGVFDGIDVQQLTGDLSDEETIDRAVADCDVVIHSAGLIHLGWRQLESSMRINRDGTAIVADAALRHDRRFIHVGSVNTMAIGAADQPSDESTPHEDLAGQIPCSYVVSKKAGVTAVMDRVKQGLRATLVHPGFMLGPWDWKPSSGRMVYEVARRWQPIAPSGGCCVCDSRDVASSTIAAIDKGMVGREYILGGENWTYLKLWTEIAKRFNRRPPLMKAGPMQRVIGGTVGDVWTRLSGTEGDVNSAGVRMSSLFHFHSSARACSELGHQCRPAATILDDASDWIRQRFLSR